MHKAENIHSMNLKVINTYHLVIYTEQLEPSITAPGNKILYKAIWEILKNKDCQLYRINGSSDHIHLLIEVSPIIPIGSIIKEIVTKSELLIQESRIFPEFEEWSDDILAFSTSFKDREKLIEFIRDQHSYHEKHTTEQEKELLLKSHGIS